ncbi:MAG: flavodoxin family protein [Spirochaetales bacterium]|nr:flavodoxin family protein [Spirochaetales bacterium]
MQSRKRHGILFGISLVLSAIFAGFVLSDLSVFTKIGNGVPVPDMQFYYTPSHVTSLFEKIGDAGRRFYMIFLLKDYGFIIFSALMQSSIIARLLDRNNARYHRLIAVMLPWVKGIFDGLENLFLLVLLSSFTYSNPGIIAIASFMTTAKWISFAAVMAVIIGNTMQCALRHIISTTRRKPMNKPIKVTGIISSPRKNGNTAVLVREALKGAEASGAETEEIFLNEYDIEFCRGCMACLAGGSCIIDDDFIQLRNRLALSDGIIFGSPNYGNTYNAIMKRFLERLGLFEFMTFSVLGDKYIAGISTAGGGNAEHVAKELTNLIKNGIFKRGYVSGACGVNLHGRQISGIPGALDRARGLGRKMCLDIQRGRNYPLQHIIRRIIITLFVKPGFEKFIVTAGKTTMKAVYEHLKTQELI